MTLSYQDRGIIEQIIDVNIASIPKELKGFRSEDIRKYFQLKDSDEFVYGIVYGKIVATVENYLKLIKTPEQLQQDAEQVAEIISKRVREIKDKIFTNG